MSVGRRIGALAAGLLLTSLLCPAEAQTTGSRIGLKNLARNRVSFFDRLGVAVPMDRLQNAGGIDPQLAPFVAAEYSMVSCENELKPAWIWTGPGSYDTAAADFLLGAPGRTGWARARGLAVRGHTVMYPRDQTFCNPRWLLDNESTITPAQARQYLRDYISFVVGRYRGKIKSWDVVNECIADGPNGNSFDLVDNFWLRKLGRDYLVLACQFAHEADPNAELYVNDYNVESSGRKADDQFALVQWLNSQRNLDNTPIRVGIGLQYHITLGETISPGDGHYAVVQRLADNGIPFQITELDVRIPVLDGPPGIFPANPADLVTQGERYREALTMAASFPNCRGFQTWGAYDGSSWISYFFGGQGAALPTDANYQPKAAYFAMQEVLGRPLSDGVYAVKPNADRTLALTAQGSGVRLARFETALPEQRWGLTWSAARGTYTLAPATPLGSRLGVDAPLLYPAASLQVRPADATSTQEFVVIPTPSGAFRLAPRNALTRTLSSPMLLSMPGIYNFDGAPGNFWQLAPL